MLTFWAACGQDARVQDSAPYRSSKVDTVLAKSPRPSRIHDALIEAARHEFAAQGYAGAKTREIARRAGTSEVMLFRHFTSKANLFRETVFQPVNAYLSEFVATELSAEAKPGMNPDQLRNFTSRLFAVIEDNATLIKALIASFDYEAEGITGVGDLSSLNDYFSKSAAELEKRIDRQDIVLDHPDILVRIVFSSMLSVSLFRKWLFPEDRFRIEDVLQVMQDVIVRGYGMDAERPAVP